MFFTKHTPPTQPKKNEKTKAEKENKEPTEKEEKQEQQEQQEHTTPCVCVCVREGVRGPALPTTPSLHAFNAAGKA
jgi:hypothetical protein